MDARLLPNAASASLRLVCDMEVKMNSLVEKNRELQFDVGINAKAVRPLPTKTVTVCPSCGKHHTLREPVYAMLNVWCDPCWHPMSTSEREDAIDAVREAERTALRQAREDGYDTTGLPVV